ncbi:pleiotropic drug resistance protein 2-like isoform X2 [Prunus dulcis]|uniref:pleiotropic drug resistance protein 2-like isoform X2 n=1 Tax=Prunus dulcis TaxID=3755 RepID=UPI00148386EA|nr:pleiotropic drug resistance protein 2-like isoform X2 [Prunus dulcis]
MKLAIPVQSKEGFVSAEEVEKKVSMLMDGKSLRLPSTEAARDIHLIPVWWRWYYWGSPIAWTIYGIFASQFGDIKTVIDTPQGPQRVDLYLKENLGHEHDFVIPVFFAHIGWVLLFFFVFAYGIKFLKLHSAAELSDLQDVK